MNSYLIIREDNDGKVFFYYAASAEDVAADIAPHLNTPGVRKVTICCDAEPG